jgi:hypothetical protein
MGGRVECLLQYICWNEGDRHPRGPNAAFPHDHHQIAHAPEFAVLEELRRKVQIGGAAGTRAQGIIKNDRLIVECGQTTDAGRPQQRGMPGNNIQCRERNRPWQGLARDHPQITVRAIRVGKANLVDVWRSRIGRFETGRLMRRYVSM